MNAKQRRKLRRATVVYGKSFFAHSTPPPPIMECLVEMLVAIRKQPRVYWYEDMIPVAQPDGSVRYMKGIRQVRER